MARAENSCTAAEGAICAMEATAGEVIGRSLRSRSLGSSDVSRPTPLHPYQGLHAAAYPLARLGFFAQSEGYSLSRRTALYDVQGGAVLQLGEGLELTAAYRMLGVDVGFDSLVPGVHATPGIAAPFLALSVDF